MRVGSGCSNHPEPDTTNLIVADSSKMIISCIASLCLLKNGGFLMFDSQKMYLGKLCKYAHRWEDTNDSLRYLCDRGCVACHSIRGEANRSTPQGKENARLAVARYRETEKGKAFTVEYSKRKERAESRALIQLRYRETEKGQETRDRAERKYRQTDARRLSWKRKHNKRRSLIADNREVYGLHEVNELFSTFQHSCAYCGSQEKLTLDHFVPVNMGGTDAIWNIVPACFSCNSSKQDDDAETWYKRKSFYSETRWQFIMNRMSNKG